MKKCLLLLAMLTLGACASQQGGRTDSQKRESARIHTELGAGYLSQNQVAIALEEFTEATRIDPTYALAYNGLGMVYAALGEDAKADAHFKRAISLDPESSESRNNYGTFLCSRNRIDESIEQFMAAVRNPLYATKDIAYLNAGLCALRKQDIDRAETYFQNALQIQPLLHRASYELALINFNRNKFGLAREYLRTPLISNPSPEVLWLAIQVERQLGNKDAEASYALELRRNYPDSEQARALLAGQ
ncbi:MAG TPA: type IV pilus biogenesis/stability protein PilW [Methylophilaceae bacterium]|jgi:type IV pilus assembly protein PilF